MVDKPSFSEDGVIGSQQNSSSGSGSSGPTIPSISEGVADLIIDGIDEMGGKDGVLELTAFADAADALPEQYAEYYELDDVDTFSVEDLFSRDWSDYDYIGTPPVFNSDKLSEEDEEVYEESELYTKSGSMKQYVIKPEYVEDFRDADVLKGGVTPITKALNGLFADKITEAFGENAQLKVGKGKKANHDGDQKEAMQYVAFWVSESKNAAYNREKARLDADEITESEFGEWAEQNGYADKFQDDYGAEDSDSDDSAEESDEPEEVELEA